MATTYIQPSKGLLDFYNNEVLKKDSLWNRFAGQRSKIYTKPWDKLTPSDRWNLKKAYENFKKFQPTFRKIAQQNLIPVEEAGQILGIPERRGPPMPKYSKGRLTSGFSITISDAMTRGTEGGKRIGTGQDLIKKVLKPKFKLQQLNVGLGEGNKRWFIKDPRKIEGGTKILQDYYLRKGGKYGITSEVMDRVKALHRNPTILKLLEKGNYANGEALAAIQNKWKWTPSEASTAVFRLAQAYNGKKFLNVDFSLPKNKSAARSIFGAIEKAPWNSAFHAKGYLIAMDTITENLGPKYFQKGSMASFKRYARDILAENKIPTYDASSPKATRYGFNLNEMVGTSPTVRTGAHPYSQFVNLMEGKFNQGHYAAYVKKLGDYQLNLQDQIAKGTKGDPSSIIKQFNKYNTQFKDIHGLKTGDLPTLSLKDPSKLYSAARLKELSGQGLDLPEHFKKAKYSIGVGDAPTIKEVVGMRETPELIKKINRIDPLKKIVEARVGCADGCLAQVAKNEPGKITRALETLPQKARGFLSLLGKGGARAAPLAALAAAGAAVEPLVKQFVADDPNTYLTNENQMKGMLLATLEGEPPKVDEEILKWQYPGLAAATVAGTVPGAGEVYRTRQGIPPNKFVGPMQKGVGPVRAALGIKGVLGKALGASFSPLAVAATLPISVAAQRAGGTDYGDIATDPMNWMAPAFASTGAEMATRGVKNPLLLKALRMGMSPRTLSLVSRRFGLPGLAVSAGMWGYDKWKNRSVNDED